MTNIKQPMVFFLQYLYLNNNTNKIRIPLSYTYIFMISDNFSVDYNGTFHYYSSVFSKDFRIFSAWTQKRRPNSF